MRFTPVLLIPLLAAFAFAGPVVERGGKTTSETTSTKTTATPTVVATTTTTTTTTTSSTATATGTFQCSSTLYSNEQCCSVDVLGVADLDCSTPTSPLTSAAQFVALCAETGQIARCCIIPVLGQSVLCTDPVGTVSK